MVNRIQRNRDEENYLKAKRFIDEVWGRRAYYEPEWWHVFARLGLLRGIIPREFSTLLGELYNDGDY